MSFSSVVSTSKVLEKKGSKKYLVGSAEMQGHRGEMEDRISLSLSLPAHQDYAFFGVFDGHSGETTAEYCKQHLFQDIDALQSFTEETIQNAILHFDQQLIKKELSSGCTAAMCLVRKKTSEPRLKEPESKNLPVEPSQITQRMTRSLSKKLSLSQSTEINVQQEDNQNHGKEEKSAKRKISLSQSQKKKKKKKLKEDSEEPSDNNNNSKSENTNHSNSESATEEQKTNDYEVTFINIGDSRCVLAKRDGTVIAATKDHKPSAATEKTRIEKAGWHVSCNRVAGIIAVSRAIGDSSFKQVEKVAFEEQPVTSKPDVFTATASSGDFLLIACDGIFDVFSSEDAAQFVAQQLRQKPDNSSTDPAMIASNMLDSALSRGSLDNMSMVLVLFQEGASYNVDHPIHVPESNHNHSDC